MSGVGDVVGNVGSMVRELIELKVRFEGLDREVHRMITAMEKTVENNDRKQEDLVRRITALEAKFAAALTSTVVEAAKKEMRPLIEEVVKDLARSAVRQNALPAISPERGSQPQLSAAPSPGTGES